MLGDFWIPYLHKALICINSSSSPTPFLSHDFFDPTRNSSWFYLSHHREFLAIESNSWCMCGTAWATNFIIISLPPMKRNFSFQLANFLLTLSLMSAKTWFLDLPIRERRPRYFPCWEHCIGPRMLKISSLTSLAVLGLKKIEDLSAFIFYSEASL